MAAVLEGVEGSATAPAASPAAAFLGRMGRGIDAPHVRIQRFRTVLLLLVAAEQYLRGQPWTAVAVAACLAASRVPRLARIAALVAAVLLGRIAAELFPITANHLYLELILLGCLAVADGEDPAEAELLVQTFRWLTVIVLFYTGLQKVLYGHYFDARFFAYYSAHYSHFRVLHGLLSEADAAMLRRFAEDVVLGTEGTGPYLVGSPALIALSNLAWMSELAASLLLFFPATRRWGVAFAALVIVAIESVAREVLFGLLMLNLILLFTERDRSAIFAAGAAVLLAALVLMRHGLLPYVTYF